MISIRHLTLKNIFFQKVVAKKLQFNERQNKIADTLPLFFQITKVNQLLDIKNNQVTKSHPWAFTCQSELIMKKLRAQFLQVCFLKACNKHFRAAFSSEASPDFLIKAKGLYF